MIVGLGCVCVIFCIFVFTLANFFHVTRFEYNSDAFMSRSLGNGSVSFHGPRAVMRPDSFADLGHKTLA